MNAKALWVEGLRKTFASSKKKPPVEAVRDISFQVECGEVIGLLGPNGAGKTTTIKCILGLMIPTEGRIEVMGYDFQRQYRQLIRSTSAVLEGSRNLYWRLSPLENLDFFTGLHGIDKSISRPYTEHLLRAFHLEDKRHMTLQELSAGMKQKVAVACALATRTPLVFLDEPTLGLDIETSYELRETLAGLAREEGRTLVISSHDMDVVQDVCQRVIIIKQGSIVADDRVNNLLELFRRRSYRFILSNGHNLDWEGRMGINFHVLDVEKQGEHMALDVDLPRPNDLYAFMDLLRELGLVVERIHQEEPDLERAFLHLVGKGEQERA